MENTEALTSSLFTLQAGSLLLWAAAALIAGLVAGRAARMYYDARPNKETFGARWLKASMPLVAPGVNIVLLAIGMAIFHARDVDMVLGLLLTDAAAAWFALTLIHTVTQSKGKTAFAALVLVPYLVLSALGLLDDVSDRLSDFSFVVGKFNLTALHVVRFVVTAVLLVWLSGAMSRGIDYSLTRARNINGNTRQLFLTIARAGIYTAAALFALSTLGIDLTAFAVFSGALGVGIGFGLQRIAANFISGIILLTERAINVGDMVEINQVSGIVRYTAARYTLIEIGDSREVMIPNETFISQPVINWTLSNTRGILRMTIPVSYNSDLDLAREIMLTAAREHPRCMQQPPPTCLLQGFTDTSINFILSVWIGDIREKRLTTQSDIQLTIWRKFRENGIGIPHQNRMTQAFDLPQKEAGDDAG